MAGGGGDEAPRPPGQATGGRRRRHQAASLPIDVMADIAARSDPVTLVRCAATCSDVRGRVADPAFRRRLRLRHAHRFVPSLLRGHLVGKSDDLLAGDDEKGSSRADEVWLVETTHTGANAATATVCRAFERCHSAPGGKRLRLHKPVASREGLLLVRTARDLRVCNPATGRSQILPPEPPFQGQYVLLVGDGDGEGEGGGGAVGWPFHVAKVDVVLSDRSLKIQTFSSEHGGAWGSCTTIRASQLRGSYLSQKGLSTALVVGNSAYFLCLTDAASYVLKLNVRAARVTAVTTLLPETFPRATSASQYLLATARARRSPIVLVADNDKVSAWAQSKHKLGWEKQADVVIHKDEIVRFKKGASAQTNVWVPYDASPIKLEWFAQRSGAVLIRMYGYGFFWLDLRSMSIVRHFSSSKYKFVYCPYEMHLSSWAPTFGSTI
ncbi:unnamed protein product [Urochloa decumbens]|uniref:DUF7595 domain-containing protein n=1 Tax=Urochloa decumbens TaxID=240449 RepID=A0ABC9G178_9POAL